MAVRRWQKSRRIYVRPRTGPQSAHLWWAAVAKLQAASVPTAEAAVPSDKQTDGSRYSKMSAYRTASMHSHVSPTCRTDAGSGPPPLNSLTFRPVVGQLSEVVLFLLLQQRCATACQAMLRRPRRCRCSRTGWRHTCSAAATKLSDFSDISFPSNYLPSRTVVLATAFTF